MYTTNLTLRDELSFESMTQTDEEHQLGSQMHQSDILLPSLSRGMTLGKLLTLSIEVFVFSFVEGEQ